MHHRSGGHGARRHRADRNIRSGNRSWIGACQTKGRERWTCRANRMVMIRRNFHDSPQLFVDIGEGLHRLLPFLVQLLPKCARRKRNILLLDEAALYLTLYSSVKNAFVEIDFQSAAPQNKKIKCWVQLRFHLIQYFTLHGRTEISLLAERGTFVSPICVLLTLFPQYFSYILNSTVVDCISRLALEPNRENEVLFLLGTAKALFIRSLPRERSLGNVAKSALRSFWRTLSRIVLKHRSHLDMRERLKLLRYRSIPLLMATLRIKQKHAAPSAYAAWLMWSSSNQPNHMIQILPAHARIQNCAFLPTLHVVLTRTWNNHWKEFTDSVTNRVYI